MKKNLFILTALAILFAGSFASFSAETYSKVQTTDKNGFKYETIKGDHLNCRIYKLNNGLTVFLRQLKDEPRIQTYIAVKAGSTYDPKETTGLAHYLEHMMFKGSDEIATSDWKTEEKYLNEISDLFELHKATKNPAEKKAIYKKIDSVSQIAAKYAIPSEYDKMIAGIGAKGTNAYTSTERTVYINDIPANELERWMTIESERFSKLVLRLFHTELETVYEEFNMYQDEDWDKVDKTMNAGLFKKHPYGTQTVIGDPEHLKNPSMVNIHKYFNTFYVPNNMCISLSGDLEFDETISMINKFFGSFKPGNVPNIIHPREEPIEKPIIKEVFGPGPEYMVMSFRLDGYNSPNRYKATIMDYILNNSKAGLIDLNLVKSQKVLEAGCGVDNMIDYSIHQFSATPREGQSLNELKNLLLKQIEKVKKGEFDDWLITASINDMKLSRMRSEEGNGIAHQFVSTFTNKADWLEYYTYFAELEKITKQDIMKFANDFYRDNYVAVYKRVGKDPSVVKVEKPEITAVEMNRDAQSAFYKKTMAMTSSPIAPLFVDFNKAIKKEKLATGVEINYIKNEINDLFQLYFILDMGNFNDKKAGLAINYLPYLGTSKYTPDELSKEFYKLGISMSVSADDERTYVYIAGLEENMEKGLSLLEHTLSNAVPDAKVYEEYMAGILKSRADMKLDKSTILWGAMYDYGKYGPQSPFKYFISEEELKAINPKELTDIIKNIFNFKHYVFYYGKDYNKAKSLVEKYHKQNAKDLKEYPKAVNFVEKDYDKNIIYVVDYDMVQSNLLMTAKDVRFDKNLLPDARMFSEYFGGGLSSIVFQEIREARALAYSAFASFTSPERPDKYHSVIGFVGTQPDKLKIATDAFMDLMNNMPKAEKQFNQSREGVMRKIESERIRKTSIFWTYLANNERGIENDYRETIYNKMKNYSIDDLDNFFKSHIKGKNFVFLLLADKSKLDYEMLKQIGEVKELSLEEVFGY